MKITIENDYLKVTATSSGGHMTSIFDKKRKKELLYQPLKNSWDGQDIFIFPQVARLVNETYTINGKQYSLRIHGLINYMEASEVIEKENSMSISFSSSEETLKRYPFNFKATITYSLKDNVLIVSYKIDNLNQETMPFMLGGHPAFMLPGVLKDDEFDFSGNKIVFEKELNLTRIDFDKKTNCFVSNDFVPFRKTDHIDLSHQLFKEYPTLVLDALNFEKIKLVKSDSSSITFDKTTSPYLGFWSDDKWGNYVCIEPWLGLPDEENPNLEFSKKKGMMFLKPSSSFNYHYSVKVD